MRSTLLLALGLFCAFSFGSVKISDPQWLISPLSNESNLVQVDGIVPNTSNNNLALVIYNERLYFAFRSATHHHPKPPIWEPKLDPSKAITRMYVVSASVRDVDLTDLSATLSKLQWRSELEVNSVLRKYVPKDESPEFDLREPGFAVEDGKLHFYFTQVRGVPMRFEPMHSWHIGLNGDTWSEPTKILQPKEHYWDIQTRHEGEEDVVYMTSYTGKHYAEGGMNVHLRRSKDGLNWENVGSREFVDQGGLCEAGIVFDEGRKKLWSVNRLEDGDRRGWGTLIGEADFSDLSDWHLPQNEWGNTQATDPKRYDSPRMFMWKDRIFLVGRQNVGKQANGEWDETQNRAFDLAFVGKSEEDATSLRAKRLDDIRTGKAFFFSDSGTLAAKFGFNTDPFAMGISRKYQETYHFEGAKRTALYELNPITKQLTVIQQLPSAGDTSFPSIMELGGGKFLIANYSSDPTQRSYSWNDGQRNRTGIYALVLDLNSP